MRGFYKKFLHITHSKRGIALVELLVALSIITVALGAMLTSLSRSIGLVRIVRDDYTASYLAAEGIEIIKNIMDTNKVRDENWFKNITSAGTGEVDYTATEFNANSSVCPGRTLSFDESKKVFAYGLGTPTPFCRTVTVNFLPNNTSPNKYAISVESRVTWSSKGVPREIRVRDYFYYWWQYE